MYLIFDCTPISKPINLKAPFTETSQWPRLLHISWILLNEEFKPIEDFDCVVKPESGTLSEDTLKWSRLDQEDIEKKGVEVEYILNKFNESVDKALYIFAHNLKTQESVLAAEYIRNTIDQNLFLKDRFCLMEEATYYCKLPSKTGGYKWPSLSELHAVCFNTTFTPSGNARADVIAAARCFIKLMKTNQLQDLFEDED